jgi:PAS domain S-box-containing protein
VTDGAGEDAEAEALRTVALSNARSIARARDRAERALREAKAALEQTNEELASSLALMQATLESTTDAILATDFDGKVTGFNERYLEMWDLPRSTLESGEHRGILVLIAPQFDDPGRFRARVEEIYADSAPESFDRLALRDGRIVERISRIQTVGGQTRGRVWSFRDITARVRAEEALRRQREWLEVTLSSIGDGVITTDMRGRITFMNRVAETMTGWTLSEASSHALADVFHVIDEDTGSPEASPIEAILAGTARTPSPSRPILVARHGAETAIEDSAAPIMDVEGDTLGAVLVFRDVAVKRRAEETLREETRALEVLNSTGSAIAAQLDLETLVQSVTDAATSLSGAKFGAFFYTIENQDGDAFLLYTLSGAPREAFARFGEPRSTALFGPTFRGEPPIRCDDVLEDPRYGTMAPHRGMPAGHLPVRSYLAVPVVSRSGNVLGGLFFGHPETGVFTSRSERIVAGIAAQAAIAIDNARLYEAAQTEIQSRHRAEEALRQADYRKDEFLAILAHELRNPLAPIRQAARIAKDPGAVAAQKAWSHDVIDRQVEHMARLLDDLLETSRITLGQLSLHKRWTTLAEVVDAAIETARPFVEAKRHTLTIDLPPGPIRIHADPVRLAQVVANLVTNAAKYTEHGGELRVCAKREAGAVELCVSDTGLGLDDTTLAHVFEMFTRSRAPGESSDTGLGIGLALVKSLVELHGGTVEAASPGIGRGSTFTVRLPEAVGDHDVPPSDSADETREAPYRGARKILVADDNRDSADSLALVLELRGHRVSVAYDGAAAVEAFRAGAHDCVVLDIGMPKLDGYEAAKRIREHAGGRPVVLVALTGWGQVADRNRAVAAGFDHHVTKPVDPDRLGELLGDD